MNKVTSGGILLILSSIAVSVFNYLLNIVLSWQLDPVAYGTIGVSQSFIFLGVWFLVAGFPWVTAQTLAKTDADDYPTIYPILKGTLWGNVLLGILLAGGLWLGYTSQWLPLGAEYGTLMKWVLFIILLLAVRQAFTAVLQGRLQFAELGLVRLVEVVVQFVSALLLVFLGYGAPGALAGFAFGTLLSLFLGGWLARDLPFWRAKKMDKRTVLALRPAIPFLLANLSGVLLVNVDLLALKFLSNPGMSDQLVAHYQVAAVLSRIPYYVSQSVMAIIFPLIAGYAHNKQQANQTARQALQLVISGVLGLNMLLIAAPHATIAFFFPPIYLSAAPTLRLLALSMSLIIVAQTFATILQARGRVWPAAIALPLAALVQFIAALWWVPQYELLGAALSSGLAGLVALLTMLLATHHTFPTMMQLSPRRLLAQGTAFALLILMAASLPQLNRPTTALWITCGVGIYAGALLLLRVVEWPVVQALVTRKSRR